MICKYAEIFCWKNVSSFCSAKATHIFLAKNFRILYIESAKTVNEMTLNKLIKLTMLWTTGPCIFANLSLLSAWRNFAFLAIQNVSSEDSDQTVQMYRPIRIFAGHTSEGIFSNVASQCLSWSYCYGFYPFIPEFLKWTFPGLNLDVHWCK